jgi:lipoate---protein ligase
LKRAIARFGINAQFTGRNDMVVDNRKFSGSAYKLTADRCMHHGTILVNLDKEKLKSKGVDSVRQRIVNLSELNTDLTYDTLNTTLVDEFLKVHNFGGKISNARDRFLTRFVVDQTYDATAEIEVLDHSQLQAIDKLKKFYDEYNNWDWRFGRTPSFEHNLETRFDWGIIDLYLNAEKGRISGVKLYSDTLYPKLVEETQKALLGETYDSAGITRAMAKVSLALTGTPAEAFVPNLRDWLISKL